VDPLSPDYPWYTPYQFAGNKPIAHIDLDGLEEKNVTLYQNNDGTYNIDKTKVSIQRNAKIYQDRQRVALTNLKIVSPDGSIAQYQFVEKLEDNGKLKGTDIYPSARYDYSPTSKINRDPKDVNLMFEEDGGYWAAFSADSDDRLARNSRAPDNWQSEENFNKVLGLGTDILSVVFPVLSLRGQSLKSLKKKKPKGWQTKPTRNNEGWIWVDKNGVERLRYMRPNGKNATNSQWARQENGYFRWKDKDGDYLDIDGNKVPDPKKLPSWGGMNKQQRQKALDSFIKQTHIPYEGTH